MREQLELWDGKRGRYEVKMLGLATNVPKIFLQGISGKGVAALDFFTSHMSCHVFFFGNVMMVVRV